MIEFPRNFLWGAATAAHQVEGNNTNSDWWRWEKGSGLEEASGAACRHYELYQEDFALAKNLGHNAHRFSIEWSRIEPRPGEFDEEALKHYRDVIWALRERNIEPIVTLHHFTNPIWFAEKGGWLCHKAPQYFQAYVSKVVETVCDLVHYWITINEPMVVVYYCYISGVWPPHKKSFFKQRKATAHLIDAHIEAYDCIHAIYERRRLYVPMVSIAKHFRAFVPCRRTLRNKWSVYLRDKLFNRDFIEALLDRGALDFLGVNYYTRTSVDLEGWGLKPFLLAECNTGCDPRPQSSLGWDIYPEGLYDILLRLAQYNYSLFILENGISVADDTVRWHYIAEHLKSVNCAMTQGVRILGYLYWSLIDNFEWDKGFGHRFGIIEVDYQTFKRTIRASGYKFAQVCRTGKLE